MILGAPGLYMGFLFPRIENNLPIKKKKRIENNLTYFITGKLSQAF